MRIHCGVCFRIWANSLDVSSFKLVQKQIVTKIACRIISEVYKDEVKQILSPLSGTVNWMLAFVVTNTFQPLTKLIQIGPTFWILAACSIVGILFVIFIVPETKGRTKQEIQENLSK